MKFKPGDIIQYKYLSLPVLRLYLISVVDNGTYGIWDLNNPRLLADGAPVQIETADSFFELYTDIFRDNI